VAIAFGGNGLTFSVILEIMACLQAEAQGALADSLSKLEAELALLPDHEPSP
jgi:hypothetical protein